MHFISKRDKEKKTSASGLSLAEIERYRLAVNYRLKEAACECESTASQIDQIKKATTQSTLKNKSKTRQGMLPQSLAPKVSVDAQGKVKPCTIETGSLAEQAGFQYDRGERPASAGPSPFLQGKEKSGVTRVFVLSKDGTPLMPCHAARARELLAKGKAVVVRRYPFVIYHPEIGRIRLSTRTNGNSPAS